jgi:hypothetical protein
MVHFRETDTHYLVYTDYNNPGHRERAKSIPGWWYDRELYCWRYPKTALTYDAIISQFGDELESHPAPPPPTEPNPSKVQVWLEETDTEYLLHVPPECRNQAKAIPDYRWDPERRRWVYPRTEAVFRALAAQFDELTVQTTSTEQFIDQHRAKIEDSSTQDDLTASLRQLLDDFKQAQLSERSTRSEDLQKVIKAQQEQIEVLMDQVHRLEDQVLELNSDLKQTRVSLQTANEERDALQRERATLDKNRIFREKVKAIAKFAAQQRSDFNPMLKIVDSPRLLAREARKRLELVLRPANDASLERFSLNELIFRSRNSGTLEGQEQFYMAHLIKEIGNTESHEYVDDSTVWARGLVSFYCLALLWPKITGDQSNYSSP